MQEVEIKYRIHDPEALRGRLQALSAAHLDRILERNRLFDTDAHPLQSRGAALRLRSAFPLGQVPPTGAAVHSLTYKGPADLRDGVKSRTELETTVADAAIMLEILAALGFCERLAFDKRRETWRLDNCLVTIDELIDVGWFTEIEGPDHASVTATAARLNLTADDIVQKTYAQLIGDHRQAAALRPRS